jgi:hypothetical protein
MLMFKLGLKVKGGSTAWMPDQVRHDVLERGEQVGPTSEIKRKERRGTNPWIPRSSRGMTVFGGRWDEGAVGYCALLS